MAKHTTRKNTPTGKRQTLDRQIIRTWKQRAPKSLDDLARELNVKAVA